MAGTGSKSSSVYIGIPIHPWQVSQLPDLGWGRNSELYARVRDRWLDLRVDHSAQLTLARDVYAKAIETVFGPRANARLGWSEHDAESIWYLSIKLEPLPRFQDLVSGEIKIHELVAEKTPALAGYFSLHFDGET